MAYAYNPANPVFSHNVSADLGSTTPRGIFQWASLIPWNQQGFKLTLAGQIEWVLSNIFLATEVSRLMVDLCKDRL